ncbi:transcription termination factor NusA [candidate division KSB1 bacterium]|nr:transcription termination factor NusA [candidate division KSB1 bacterium]
MRIDISDAVSQLTKEKNIDRELMSSIIEEIMVMMIRKKYGSEENFDVFVNIDKGEIEIYQNKTIVEEVLDSNLEVDLETARKVEPDLKVGDEFIEIVDPRSFGRRLVIAAKQHLNQRLRELEKNHIYDEFKHRIGEIIVGDIRQINRGNIYLNIDRTEVELPREEQIQNERYRRGESLRAIIKSVESTSRGPEIIVSRRDPQFLIRLLELEVPEIYDGVIEIRDCVRTAGERAKIAVYSNDKRIDAVGACVGMKGIRIQAIVRELNNEKIDVINWSSDPEIYITRALSPARPIFVTVDERNHSATAIIADEQASIAIGKGGVNRKLASKLAGYEIEILKDSEHREMLSRAHQTLEEIDVGGIGKSVLAKLQNAGINTIEDVLRSGEVKLKDIQGIGNKTAEKIMESVRNFVEE